MRKLPIATLALAVTLLSGCVPTSRTMTPSPIPSATPVFASEDDALAAAEAAYARYVKLSDQILTDGGTNPGRIDAVATGDMAKVEKAGFADFKKHGYHSLGSTSFTGATLQGYNPESPGGLDIVRIYVCSDVSAVDVVDMSGVSIVSPDRPARTAFEVGFDLMNSSSLIVSSKDVWEQGGVCP